MTLIIPDTTEQSTRPPRDGLRRPGPTAVHLCLDVQNLFAPGGPWPTPWMPRVLPVIAAIAERYAARTLFTRFVPAAEPGAAGGAWGDFYRHWPEVTLAAIEPDQLELVPELARLVPPARIIDKRSYSAFSGTDLGARLIAAGIDTVVVTGAETDVCVLASVLAAVDLGFRVFVVTDAVCSSSDRAHDAVLTLYGSRLKHQIIDVTAEELFALWPAA